MKDITLPLKEILDKGFPEPDPRKMISPGSYKKVVVGILSPKNSKTIRVGFFFDGPFLPIRNGASYTLYNLMRALAQVSGIEPVFFNCYRGYDELHLYKDQPFTSLLIGPEDYYHDTGLIRELVQEYDISVAQFYNGEVLLNLGGWLKKQRVRCTLEVQNIEHILLERLGADKETVGKTRESQGKAITAADHVFCRSEIDRNFALEMSADPSSITIYKGGIMVDDFKFLPRFERRNRLVYLGHMYYQPNEDAVSTICQTILPHLNEDFSLTVIGNCPPYLRKKLANNQVTFRQDINDISSELLEFDIALAPLFAGSGTRLKLLDYLASGIPIITTDIGIEGLDPQIRNYMTLENNVALYAGIIEDIYKNKRLYGHRSKQGRRFVQREYDWSVCVNPFVDTYRKIVK